LVAGFEAALFHSSFLRNWRRLLPPQTLTLPLTDMALGLSKDAWQQTFEYLKDYDLIRLYMTGDMRLMHVLRTASFLLQVRLHRRRGGPTFDLTSIHQMFPNINRMSIVHEQKSYNKGIPSLAYSPRDTPTNMQFRSVRVLAMTAGTHWVYGPKIAPFLSMFPALEWLRVDIGKDTLLCRFVAALPSTLRVLRIDRYRPSNSPLGAKLLPVGSLPRSLISLRISMGSNLSVWCPTQNEDWPPALTSLNLSTCPTLILIKSLPPHLERLHITGDFTSETSIPYSAFPASLTHLWLGPQSVELDKPLNPELKCIKCDIRCSLIADFRRFMLPLPRQLMHVQWGALVTLAETSPNPLKFVLEDLPPGINKIDLASFVWYTTSDNQKPIFNFRDVLAQRPNMPPIPAGVSRDEWVNRFHYLARESSAWSSPITGIRLGGEGSPNTLPDLMYRANYHLDEEIAPTLLDSSHMRNVTLWPTFCDYSPSFIAKAVTSIAASKTIRKFKLIKCDLSVLMPIFQTLATPNTSITRLLIRGSKCSLDELMALATSMPNLKELTATIFVQSPFYTPVISIRELGDKCPNLKTLDLDLRMDSTVILGLFDPDFALYLPRRLRSLSIVCKSMSYPDEDFEKLVFPNLPASLRQLKLHLDCIDKPGRELNFEALPRTLRQFEYKELCN
jgi:hypothetical protein